MRRKTWSVGLRTGAIAAALGAQALASAALSQPVAGLVVEVEGLHSGQGQVLCFLYASAAGFPADPARAAQRVVAPIAGQAATCRFAGVAPGAYAVAVVHDENGNGRLDRNLLGIPSEGVGASMNPVTHFGPPTFGAARFEYGGGARTLTVRIHYL